MRAHALVLACLTLGGCHPPPDTALLPSPSAYASFKDQLGMRLYLWGVTWTMPCMETYDSSQRPVDWEEHCFKFTKPQRMSGLWRNGFEFQVFCAAPAKQCPEPRTRPHDIPVYGNVEFRTYPKGASDVPPDGVYAIDFIGRRSIYPLFGGANEIGKRVIVERLLAIKLVDPPPTGLMTKELVETYRKDCAGAAMCMPNSEVDKVK